MKKEKVIVALTNGWVFIGLKHTNAQKMLYLSEASCVRRWGTTAGLGELALTGPTGDTVLDPCGVVVFPNKTAILFIIPCDSPGVK